MEKATFTLPPPDAVMPFPLKLASLKETVICPVEMLAFMPSVVAFSADEFVTTTRLLAAASKPTASRMA